jgi:hypothetical protein
MIPQCDASWENCHHLELVRCPRLPKGKMNCSIKSLRFEGNYSVDHSSITGLTHLTWLSTQYFEFARLQKLTHLELLAVGDCTWTGMELSPNISHLAIGSSECYDPILLDLSDLPFLTHLFFGPKVKQVARRLVNLPSHVHTVYIDSDVHVRKVDIPFTVKKLVLKHVPSINERASHCMYVEDSRQYCVRVREFMEQPVFVEC